MADLDNYEEHSTDDSPTEATWAAAAKEVVYWAGLVLFFGLAVPSCYVGWKHPALWIDILRVVF
ncbi:hypothetical protein LCGC14_0712790 [marine sediment metagenome]|uniref:Uncharacterized protein n=1 Tax=marine sediment metagenome TaxID=412755 RepID=A0A0F9QJ03_9ZZZZ